MAPLVTLGMEKRLHDCARGEGDADWTVEEADEMTRQRESVPFQGMAKIFFFPLEGIAVRDWLIGRAR